MPCRIGGAQMRDQPAAIIGLDRLIAKFAGLTDRHGRLIPRRLVTGAEPSQWLARVASGIVATAISATNLWHLAQEIVNAPVALV